MSRPSALEREADAAPFSGAFSFARAHAGAREHARHPEDADAVLEALLAGDVRVCSTWSTWPGRP
jgi:hypothetical protein